MKSGYRSIVTTQHYAKILDVKVEEDMSQLQEKLDEKAEKEWSKREGAKVIKLYV